MFQSLPADSERSFEPCIDDLDKETNISVDAREIGQVLFGKLKPREPRSLAVTLTAETKFHTFGFYGML